MHLVGNNDTLEQARLEGRAPWTDVVVDTRDYVVFYDKYPVTESHTLIVPKTNTPENIAKCFRYAIEAGNHVVSDQNNAVSGFNVGLNSGASAGQTCMYPHVHLIFRTEGDVEDPVGGVRNVIPGMGNYRLTTYNDDTNASN